MDGWLTKPIDTAALTALLDETLPAAHALRMPAGALVLPASLPDIDPRIFDVAYFVATFGGLTEEARLFLRGFLLDAPRMIAAINDALAAGDLPRAHEAAHMLKGAARSAGALRLGQIAADTEEFCEAGNHEMASLLAGLLAETQQELQLVTVPLLEQGERDAKAA
jgi:HPt (histidine-containing phosphotransfer) domain-containing protein